MKHLTHLSEGIVILSLILLSACSSTQPPSDTESETLKIGALTPLTGDLAVIGERMQNAMILAKTELESDDPDLKIDFVFENACFAKETIPATQKLINLDNVKIIGSSFCLFGHVPILPITEAEKVIAFNIAANPDDVLNKNYAFSTHFAIRDDSKEIAEYVANDLGAKKIAIMHLQTPFGESYLQYLTQYFEELGGEVVASSAQKPDARDYRTEITKMKEGEPDAVVAIHFGTPLGLFLKQAKELDLDVPIIGDYESEDPSVVDAAQGAADGLIFSSTPITTDFVQKYRDAYGADPDVVAANSYDAVYLQVAAYKACGLDTDCMADRLRSVRNFKGASGKLTMNPDGSMSKPTIFKEVRDGKFVIIKD